MARQAAPGVLDQTSPDVLAAAAAMDAIHVVIIGALDWCRRDLAQAIRHDSLATVDGGEPAALRLPGEADVILLDARVSPEEALDALARLRSRDWAVPCVVIAPRVDEDVVAEAMRLGATQVVHPPIAGLGLASLLAKLG